MITNIISILTLIPSEGKVLTNGEVYSTQVYLGNNDSPDNWWEIDIEDMPEGTIL